MMRSRGSCILAMLVCACGGSSSTGEAYKGVLAGTNETGVLDATRQEHQFNTVATLKVGSQSLPENGSLDPVVGTFVLDGTYHLVGQLQGGNLTGTYSGPNGNGVFAAQATASATVYCGTFSGSAQGTLNAVQGPAGIDLAFAGASFSGVATGTASGASFSASASPASFNGTLSGGTLSGTWTGSGSTSGSGTFTASASACP